ncbi:MAG: hypothetical protein QOE81_236 [Verrucomicrobiota bacterium]
MSRWLLLLFVLAIGLRWSRPAIAQTSTPSSNDAVRVTVSLNADGSRTVYQFDNAKHEAIATTTDSDGKAHGKIVYQIGDAGRFGSGVVYGPDEKFLFKTIYKYDVAGRLEQENHLANDDSVVNKIVYKYDPKGKPAGYSVFDHAGKLISGAAAPTPTTTAKPRNALGR